MNMRGPTIVADAAQQINSAFVGKRAGSKVEEVILGLTTARIPGK